MDGADRAGQAEPAAGGLARTGCAVPPRKGLPRAMNGMSSPGGHALSRASCSPAYSCDVAGRRREAVRTRCCPRRSRTPWAQLKGSCLEAPFPECCHRHGRPSSGGHHPAGGCAPPCIRRPRGMRRLFALWGSWAKFATDRIQLARQHRKRFCLQIKPFAALLRLFLYKLGHLVL